MGVIVTVLIKTDIQVALDVERELRDVHDAVLECARRHGMRSHVRRYGDGAMLDVDEWDDEAGRDAFRREATPLLARLADARGASEPPVVQVWRTAEDQLARLSATPEETRSSA